MPKSSYTPATAGSWALSWPREPRAPPCEAEPLRASLRAGATGSCRSHNVAPGSTRSGGGWTRPPHWAGEGAGPGHRREILPSERYRDRVTLDGGEGRLELGDTPPPDLTAPPPVHADPPPDLIVPPPDLVVPPSDFAEGREGRRYREGGDAGGNGGGIQRCGLRARKDKGAGRR
jgi:hypothetical protein